MAKKTDNRQQLLEQLVPQPPIYAPPQPVRAYPPVGYPSPPPLPPTLRNMTATVMVNGDAAVAEVSYQVPPAPAEMKKFQESEEAQFYGAYPAPKVFTGTGASKRERGDAHDPVTGEILAAARAFDELAARLFREARGRVRAQDAEKYQRSKRRTKEQWEAMQARPIDLDNLPDASGEFTGTYDKGEPLDATAIVKKSLMNVAEGLQTVIDVLK